MRFTIYTFFTALLLLTVFSASAEAQRRDYLTDAEIELVRDAQQIDLRIEVLVRAIDRRFAILKNETTSKKSEKDADKWGALPKGTRSELISDITKILQKAVDDIDDVAARNMDSKFFPKAVDQLAESAERFLPQFKTLFDQIKDEKERGSILNAIDLCNQIIEAAKKIPKEVKKK